MIVMSEIAIVAGLCSLAYICGSIPFGKIIAQRYGVDIQKLGSRNIGATNIYRVMKERHRRKYNVKKAIAAITFETFGESDKAVVKINDFFNKYIGKAEALANAALVFGLDAAKGAVPVFFAVKVLDYPLPISSWLSGWSIDLLLPVIITSFVAACAVLGAHYSFLLKITTGSFKAGKGVGTYLGILSLVLGWGAWLTILAIWFIFILLFIAGGRKSAASLILIGGSPILYLVFPAPMLIIFACFMIPIALRTHWENILKLSKGKEKPTIHFSLFSLPDLIAKYFPAESKRKSKKSKDKP